jgi:DNA-binding IclR family transcriptional regulator
MSDPAGRDTPVNQSIVRATRLLRLFTVENPELSLSQMAVQLGVSRATVHRYATALRGAGLLRMSPSGYSLGPRVIELAATAIAGLRVASAAGPFLARLVDVANETAVLSVWDGDAPVVVRVDDNTTRTVRINVRPGARLERDSAQGTIFRAHPPISERGLSQVAAEGLAFKASRIEGIAALATPVFQADGIVASLALVGTLPSIAEARKSSVGAALREVGAALSAELGHAAQGNGA